MRIIRPMAEADIEQVEAIEKKVFSLPWSYKSFADACSKADNVYLVCECDGVIAGYCGMWTVLGEGNVTNMAVDEAFRKQGIAGELLESMHAAGKEKGVETFFLEVRASNEPAIRLYEKSGYKQIGKRKRFYERPVEDALVMSKSKYINTAGNGE